MVAKGSPSSDRRSVFLCALHTRPSPALRLQVETHRQSWVTLPCTGWSSSSGGGDQGSWTTGGPCSLCPAPSSPLLPSTALPRRQKGLKSILQSLQGRESQGNLGGKINFSPSRGPRERLQAGGKYPRGDVSTWSWLGRHRAINLLIWASAAPFCPVCCRGTRAGSGDGKGTRGLPDPASPGLWATLAGPKQEARPCPPGSPEPQETGLCRQRSEEQLPNVTP